jgi:hypothetical protein
VADGIGYKFRIEFAEAVQGPVALGYAAHFGLGLFVALEKELCWRGYLNGEERNS